MWQKIDTNVMNIEHGKYYKTCLIQNGSEYNVQKMKFEKGLWWNNDQHYTYYAPTHFWV